MRHEPPKPDRQEQYQDRDKQRSSGRRQERAASRSTQRRSIALSPREDRRYPNEPDQTMIFIIIL